MTQWTAAIRLSMYEHASLYEAYTGSLIAARGKNLPGIQSILMPTKFKHEDWARVRFGAGTPWRRCWFVINPPNEKEIQKARKAMKKSAYDRLSVPVLGNIQFFETKKTKKVQPIATVTNVYSAYAIYPQSKALIDQSTLVKLEGRIHMHRQPGFSSEGLVFVMPELHAAVSGFETMLRFLFPTFDTFNLYGRPTRLVADTNHIKSIMFAFPKQRRYGYLDVLDITNLLQIPGSQEWSEAEWRKQLKEATQKRISTGRSRTNSVNSSRPRYRSSVSIRNRDSLIDPIRQPFSPPGSKPEFAQSAEAVIHEIPNNEPPLYHSRGMSDITGIQTGPRPGHASIDEGSPHSSAQDLVQRDRAPGIVAPIAEHTSSESDRPPTGFAQPRLNGEQFPPRTPPSPVASPPSFVHGPRSTPANRPEATSEQRLASNRISHATLSQLTSVGAMGMAGSAVKFGDQPSAASIDQLSQGHPPKYGFSPAQAAYMNPALAQSSSDEGIDIAIPARAPQTLGQPPATPSTGGTPSPQRRINVNTAKAVKRKPLPQKSLFGQEPLSPDGEPSFDDLRHTLDEDALNRIAPRLPSPVSPHPNEDESIYDDASTVSPDYASTRESVHSKKSEKSVTRPRMGVMKTVGMPTRQDLVIGDAHYSTERPTEATNSDIPTVDFGPTLTYMPITGRPSTGDTLRKVSNQRNDLDVAERYMLSSPTSQMDRGHQRTPSQEEYRRSVLWQPGMATNRPVTPAGGLTPEQYVQQRAAPSPPMHMHHRSLSNNPSSPQPRPASGDWANQVRSSPRLTAHQDPNYRPSSSGTEAMLNSYNDVSSHLSAREQEHVARMTGSSFFNLNKSNRKPQPELPGRGLVSAIDAREREKRDIREGMSNQMVQHAIAHRQQIMNQQPYAPQHAGTMYLPQQAPQHSMYNLPGASHTWDALNQMSRPDEPRRSSWYGQIPQAAAQVPSSYQKSQPYAQPGDYPGNYNTMHY